MANTQTFGAALALTTSVLWAVGPMFMASAGRRIGAQNVNLLRMALAGTFLGLVFLPVYLLARPSVHLPAFSQLRWVIVSGVFGQAIGDFFFYEALVRLGPRRAIKMNTLAPVAALLMGWAWLHETLGRRDLFGVAMVLGAIAYATIAKTGARPAARQSVRTADAALATPEGDIVTAAVSREPGVVTPAGLACGALSALCTAAGTVFGRKAFSEPATFLLDPALATVFRVLAAGTVLWTVGILTGRTPRLSHLKDGPVRARILAGTVLGTLLGMFCYVAAMKNVEAGVVSTLVAASPLVAIPLVAVRYRARIPAGMIIATAIAVVGVGLISWK